MHAIALTPLFSAMSTLFWMKSNVQMTASVALEIAKLVEEEICVLIGKSENSIISFCIASTL